MHNNAWASTLAVVDPPEPGGPVNNHECVISPLGSAAARAAGSFPARAIARAARAAATNVARTPPIGQRLLQTWVLTSGLPVVAILLMFLA
ncbi:hypothetical protein ACH0BO_12070 [Brevibacterium luteolum]|uniref:hypothetical protein n=1 Tax=Brevibacterium luteolum TaxID=199591 RepID=UPI0038797F50